MLDSGRYTWACSSIKSTWKWPYCELQTSLLPHSSYGTDIFVAHVTRGVASGGKGVTECIGPWHIRGPEPGHVGAHKAIVQ